MDRRPLLFEELQIESNLVPYLELTGWEAVDDSPERWFVFRGEVDSEGEPLEIVLPRNPKARDLRIYVENVVNLLSALADETIQDTLRRIVYYDRDMLCVRNLETEGYNSITLRVAAQQVNELRQMVRYAACSEREPKPYFLSGELGIAKKMIEHYRFGHTFSGSFGFTIESRIVRLPSPYEQLKLLPEGDEPPSPRMPVERRVMERIVRGLAITQQATTSLDSQLLVREYPRGFNSNMCQAIVKMSREKKPLEYSVFWSPKIMPPQDIEGVGPVRLIERSYDYLAYAAKELRQLEPEHVTIRGRVTGLTSKDDPLGASTRRSVVIRGTFPDITRPVDVVVELDRDDYVAANGAHIDWNTVEIDGIIGRSGHAWRLSDPTNFRVMW